MRRLMLAMGIVLSATATLISADAQLTPEVLIPGFNKTDAHNPAIAAGKDGYLIVWEAGRNEKADLVAMRLDKSGKPLDSMPFVVTGAKDCQQRPQVAFGGGEYLVAWNDLRGGKAFDVYAARVSPDGKVLDADGIPVAIGDRQQCDPALIFAGGNFQLLWREFTGDRSAEITQATFPSKANKYKVFGNRMSVEGKLIDGDSAVIFDEQKGPGGWQGKPALLAIADGRVLAGSASGGWGHRITFKLLKDGKVDGAGGVLEKKTIAPEFSLATDGKGVLMNWTTFREAGGRGGGAPSSGLALLSIDGGEVKIAEGKGPYLPSSWYQNNPWGAHPSAAWDGRNYVLVWDVGMKNGLTYEIANFRQITASGDCADAGALIAGQADSPACRPVVASDGAGTSVIVYERHPKTAEEPIMIGLRILHASQPPN